MAGPTLASQRTFPQQEIEIVSSAPVSISDLPLNPRVSSVVGATTAAGRTAFARASVLPAPLLRKGYVLQFRNNLYLHKYGNDGVHAVASLNSAKIFSAPPLDAADLFSARICVVLCLPDGSGARRTILPIYPPLTDRTAASYRSACGTPKTEVSVFVKAGNDEKETVHETCREEVDAGTSETNVGIKSNDTAGNSDSEKGGFRELTQKTCALSKTRAKEGVGWAKTCDSPFHIKPRNMQEPGERIVTEFLERYLSDLPDYPIRIRGTQPALCGPDLLLFDGPVSPIGNLFVPTTLAIEANVLMKPRAEVLQILKSKIDASRAAFAGSR